METAGPYRILGQLGAGGMGVVYRAEDTRLGRQVALKFLSPSLAGDERASARLEREARTASALNHPNICTIYEIGEHEGRRFIAMEFLDGTPLAEAIGGRPMEVTRVLDIGSQVADALDAAHAAGVIHRDVKPANIFITRRGHAKVLDFGIARATPEARSSGAEASEASTVLVTQPGAVTGTIAYMSPEQALSQPVDARSDLFSLGLVLFEMATGRQTFEGTTAAAVYDGILNREAPSVSSINPAVPAQFDEILGRALEKDPALRYQTAADLRADLQRLKRNIETQRLTRSALGQTAPTVVIPPPASAPLPTSAPAVGSSSRPPRWVGPAIGGIVVALAAVFFASRLPRASSPPPAAPVQPAPLPTTVAADHADKRATDHTENTDKKAANRTEDTDKKATGRTEDTERKAANHAARADKKAAAEHAARVDTAVPDKSASSPAPVAPAPPTPAAAASAREPLADTQNAGRGSPELESVRAKMQAKDFDGAATELREVIAKRTGDRAPVELYNALLDLEERRNERVELPLTLDDMIKRFPSDQRLPGFLLRHAEAAMLKTSRPGHLMYAHEFAKHVVDAFPQSPEAVGARALLKEINGERGRRGGG